MICGWKQPGVIEKIMALQSEDMVSVLALPLYHPCDLVKYSLINLSDPFFPHLSNGNNAVSIKCNNAFLHALIWCLFESGMMRQALS